MTRRWAEGKNNFTRRHTGLDNDSGVILIVVLWIVVVLTILALGMGRRGQIDLALARFTVGQMRAQNIALAGVRYAVARIAQDSQDEVTSKFDTSGQCGFRLGEARSAEEIFRHVPVRGGYFDIVASVSLRGKKPRFGMSDEESRLNLNALTPADSGVLKYLVMGLGYPEKTAETVASAVVDWIDADNAIFNEPYGDESGNLSSGQSGVKNLPFASVAELLLVKGVTPEIFAGLKDDLTVFPRNGRLLVNADTASPAVLRAVARNFSGPRTNTTVDDADALVDKILIYRRGSDAIEGTADDRVVEGTELGLNSRENSIFLTMEGNRTRTAQFLRLGVRGVDDSTGSAWRAEAVISRADGRIVYWHHL